MREVELYGAIFKGSAEIKKEKGGDPFQLQGAILRVRLGELSVLILPSYSAGWFFGTYSVGTIAPVEAR